MIYTALLIAVLSLPVSTTLPELLTESEHYDGTSIITPCRVTALTVHTGRMGSRYAQIVCAESFDVVGYMANLDREVFSFIPGDDILIQGKYHHRGWVGGVPYNHFVDVKATYTDRRTP